MFRLVFMTFHGRASLAHRRLAIRIPATRRPRTTTTVTVTVTGTCTTRRRPWRSCSWCSPSGRCWPATSACRTRSAAHNRIDKFLEPSFHPAAFVDGGAGPRRAGRGTAEAEAAKHKVELSLMGVSSAVALAGIGLATFFFLRRRDAADRAAERFAGLHRLLLNKYYVDELYDAAIVHPVQRTSERLLWRSIDAGVIDGAVNGTGAVVRGWAAVLRLAQTGSVRTYAASLFLGVLVVLGIT
jgi:NADH:ubiquinone oxidoreductase subunit 5 (subunit L)/multisubunit Na+/H+ antiporter MnhA subunit